MNFITKVLSWTFQITRDAHIKISNAKSLNSPHIPKVTFTEKTTQVNIHRAAGGYVLEFVHSFDDNADCKRDLAVVVPDPEGSIDIGSAITKQMVLINLGK